MQDELLVSLVLFQNLLIDLVALPVLETLGLGLGKTGAHGKTGLGQVHGLFVLVGHEYPFRIHTRTLSRPLGTKIRPSLQSWDEALSCGIAAHALRLTTQLRCAGKQYASHPILGWPISATIPATPTEDMLPFGAAAPG